MSYPHADQLSTFLDAKLISRDTEWGLLRAQIANHELWIRDNGATIPRRVRIQIQARDIAISLDKQIQTSILNSLPCTVASIEDDRDQTIALISLDIGGESLVARITRKSAYDLALKIGQSVFAQIKSVAMVL